MKALQNESDFLNDHQDVAYWLLSRSQNTMVKITQKRKETPAVDSRRAKDELHGADINCRPSSYDAVRGE